MSERLVELDRSDLDSLRVAGAESRGGSVDPWLVLRRHARLIFTLTLIAMVATALATSFLVTKMYRAEAVLRPVNPSSKMGGVVGDLASMYSQMGSLVVQNADAQEYIAILKGFTFTNDLIRKHNLMNELLRNRPKASGDPRWRAYRIMNKRFDCEYSSLRGILTVYYLDPDSRNAERILGFYLNDLRDLLRARDVDGARNAIASMEDEAKSTSDALMRGQLFELIAKQIEREKLAQVEADFAFKVLEEPSAEDRPYSPSPFLATTMAGMAVLVLSSFWVVTWTWLSVIFRRSRPNFGLGPPAYRTRENITPSAQKTGLR